MRVLLTEGSGLTSRQVAVRLGELGHDVEILSSSSLCLARFVPCVRRVHRVPAFARDPMRWLDAASTIARARVIDLVLPTQEQVTVLSARRSSLTFRTLVPPFAALRRVQDKVSAARTLDSLGVPQPRFRTCRRDELDSLDLPVFLKRAISTASTGVRRVETKADALRAFDALGEREVLAQAVVSGELVMVQMLADRGRLVALHANRRVREGTNGGASSKESIDVPGLRSVARRLVAGLAWHGPLSADVIVGADGPSFIDVNPRLVEPRNAWLSGVDLVGLALDIAQGEHPPEVPSGRVSVRSHQLLLAELRAASDAGRLGVLRELGRALLHRGDYRGSVEELTPWGGIVTMVPCAAVTTAVLASPRAARYFTRSSVEDYAVTPSGWAAIVAQAGADP